MKTMPDTNQAASFQQTASADVPARFINRNLHRLWQRRRLRATLLRPFRRILRPLLVWLRRDALRLRHTPPASLRRVGWESLALGLLLGPLAFLMLLPLLLLLFPAALLIGLAGVAAAALQADAEETEHHSLAWHALH
jgi:hypothetical protein